MKSRHVLRRIGWNSLAGMLVLLLLPAVTEADPGGISLDPNHPSACDRLTIQWPPTQTQSYSVEIVDKNDGQTLLQTNVTGPTASVQWLVNATNGAYLHLAIHTPPDFSSQPYKATGFQVHTGPTSCPTPDPTTATTTAPSNPTPASSTQPLTSTPASSAASPSTTATVASQTSTAAITSSTPPTTAGASTASSTSTSDSQLQSGTYGDTSSSGPSTSTQISSSAHSSAASSDPDTSSSPSRAVNPGAIAGAVVGSLAGIALVVLALCLLRRRARRRTGAQEVSSFSSHIGWLPQLSRSSYQAESLCSDSHLSEVESEKPIAAWNPRLFVREREKTYAVSSRSPLVQHSSLPSGTTVTVASAEDTEGTQA